MSANIFFKFIKANKSGFFNSKTVTTIIPISKLKYIDYDHSTNNTTFHFLDGKVEINPENKEYNVLKAIETQINNGYNFIDIKDE